MIKLYHDFIIDLDNVEHAIVLEGGRLKLQTKSGSTLYLSEKASETLLEDIRNEDTRQYMGKSR